MLWHACSDVARSPARRPRSTPTTRLLHTHCLGWQCARFSSAPRPSHRVAGSPCCWDLRTTALQCSTRHAQHPPVADEVNGLGVAIRDKAQLRLVLVRLAAGLPREWRRLRARRDRAAPGGGLPAAGGAPTDIVCGRGDQITSERAGALAAVPAVRKLSMRSRAQPPALTVLCSGQHICKLSADLGDIPQVILQPGAPEPRGRTLPLLLRPLQKLRQGRNKAGRRQARVGAGSDVLGGAAACCTLHRCHKPGRRESPDAPRSCLLVQRLDVGLELLHAVGVLARHGVAGRQRHKLRCAGGSGGGGGGGQACWLRGAGLLHSAIHHLRLAQINYRSRRGAPSGRASLSAAELGVLGDGLCSIRAFRVSNASSYGRNATSSHRLVLKCRIGRQCVAVSAMYR